MFAAEIRKRRIEHHSYSNWRWHLDEVFVRINGEMHYFWRAVNKMTVEVEVVVDRGVDGDFRNSNTKISETSDWERSRGLSIIGQLYKQLTRSRHFLLMKRNANE